MERLGVWALGFEVSGLRGRTFGFGFSGLVYAARVYGEGSRCFKFRVGILAWGFWHWAFRASGLGIRGQVKKES